MGVLQIELCGVSFFCVSEQGDGWKIVVDPKKIDDHTVHLG